jgi:hypothetical protein
VQPGHVATARKLEPLSGVEAKHPISLQQPDAALEIRHDSPNRARWQTLQRHGFSGAVFMKSQTLAVRVQQPNRPGGIHCQGAERVPQRLHRGRLSVAIIGRLAPLRRVNHHHPRSRPADHRARSPHNPQRPAPIHQQSGNHRIRQPVDPGEIGAVKPGEPGLGADPQAAVRRLGQRGDIPIRQPVLDVPTPDLEILTPRPTRHQHPAHRQHEAAGHAAQTRSAQSRHDTIHGGLVKGTAGFSMPELMPVA